MKRNSKIGIIGGYGFHNVGDDMQLYNNVKVLKTNGYKHLFVMSPDNYIADLCNLPKIFPSFHSILKLKHRDNDEWILQKYELLKQGSIDYPKNIKKLSSNMQKMLRFINGLDVLFFSGSGTINTRSLYGLLVMLTPCLIAKNLGKKVILSGQGFLPFENPTLERIIAEILNQCDKIFTRDFEIGKKALNRIGVNQSKVILGIDDAFTTPPSKKLKLPEKTIAINVSRFIQPNLYKVFYNLAKKLKKEGYNPIFNYFQDDRKVAEGCSQKEFSIYEFEHIADIVDFYYKVTASIGMRYHSTILGLAGGNPTINIYVTDYQKYKISAIQNATGLTNFMINYKDCNATKLYNMIQKAIKYQPAILKKINTNWRKKSNLAIDYLKKL